MHTPDGFLTSWVCVVTLLLSVGTIIFSIIRVRNWITKKRAISMSLLAVLIFAFQMINFSIGNGTSGHFIGAGLVAILLIPEAAVLVMTSVLLIQALVFGDGGILSLGANIILMGVVTSYTTYFIYRSLKKKNFFTTILASWAGVVVAAFMASVFIGVSNFVPFKDVLQAMVFTHIFIGLGEGILTGNIQLVLNHLKNKNAFMMPKKYSSLAYTMLFSFVSILVLVSLALPFASKSPDGLESVALRLGFFENAREVHSLTPLQDYSFLGQENYVFALLSAVIGMSATFVLSLASYTLLLPRKRPLSMGLKG